MHNQRLVPPMAPANTAPALGIRPRSEPAGGDSFGGAEPDLCIGQDLCGYTILRKLAESSMSVVYEGIHRKLGRPCAIKVLKGAAYRFEDVVEQFYHKARAFNAIRHEHIADIHDFGGDPYGRIFFVMEHLDGEPLSERLQRGALAWPEVLPILDQTLRALEAVHDQGFIHGGLTPDNIWLTYVEGRVQVKLLDLGIPKLVGSDCLYAKLPKGESAISASHYLSPEQIIDAMDIDHRTDIYAMGVITYEMFAGVPPFMGDTLQAIVVGHLFKKPPRLAGILANLVPAPIADIVDHMLAKDAVGRYDSMIRVLSDLQALADDERSSTTTRSLTIAP